MAASIGDLTVSIAREDEDAFVVILETVTGLTRRRVRGRLDRANGNMLLRNAFEDEWPYDAERLGPLTVAQARELGFDAEIAWCTDLSERSVRLRLNRGSGNKKLSNAFPEMHAVTDDEAEGDDHSLDTVLAKTVADALGCSDCLDTLSLQVGLSRRSLRRSLKEIRGNTLVANAISRIGDVSSGDRKSAPPQSASTKSPIARGTLINRRWRVVRSLGSGGFGYVYEATDATQKDGRTVVIKFPKDHERAEMLKKEIALAYDLRHPNICGYRDLGTDKQHGTFLVLDHGGISLADWIEREGAMSADAAVDIVTQVARGLDYAHEEGVVHQDIKPDNILIEERDDGRLRARIADFGIAAHGRKTARTRGGGHTMMATSFVGYTPGYAAPEHRLGDPRPRSDQYALALVLCSVLEGRNSLSEGYKRRDFRRLSARQNAAIARALKFDPNDRFDSCGAFAAALGTPVKPGRGVGRVGVVTAKKGRAASAHLETEEE